MEFEVERDWVTAAGFRAVAIFNHHFGHRCGYVGVPNGHPLHGADYAEPTDALLPPGEGEQIGKRSLIPLLVAAGNPELMTAPDVVFDVHGGLTYSGGNGKYPVESDLWWLGFDCGHAGDRTRYNLDGEERSLEYVVDECESLARQITERVRATGQEG